MSDIWGIVCWLDAICHGVESCTEYMWRRLVSENVPEDPNCDTHNFRYRSNCFVLWALSLCALTDLELGEEVVHRGNSEMDAFDYMLRKDIKMPQTALGKCTVLQFCQSNFWTKMYSFRQLFCDLIHSECNGINQTQTSSSINKRGWIWNLALEIFTQNIPSPDPERTRSTLLWQPIYF
jgi:hypothetical protein